MPHWKIKALIQGTLSRLPDPQRWNRVMQKYVTRSLSISDDYLLHKWGQAQRHVRNYRSYSGQSEAFSALELGTGWFPINPVGLAMNGASPVYTVDRQNLLQVGQIRQVLERYRDLMVAGRIDAVEDGTVRRLTGALEVAKDGSAGATDVLEAIGIVSIVGDARSVPLDSGSVDLICSNNTLEHIPGQVIGDIFREFRRLLANGGLMSHHIDLSDHYAGFDPSISVYHFLRYSEQEWARYNNELQYQNRLRLSDYLSLHRDAGWRLIAEDSSRESLEALRAIPLAEQFRGYDELDLAVHDTWLQSVPATA